MAQLTFSTTADGAVNFLFSNVGTAELALDNVSLTPHVPEANTSVLLLVGASLLGFVMVRRVFKQRYAVVAV